MAYASLNAFREFIQHSHSDLPWLLPTLNPRLTASAAVIRSILIRQESHRYRQCHVWKKFLHIPVQDQTAVSSPSHDHDIPYITDVQDIRRLRWGATDNGNELHPQFIPLQLVDLGLIFQNNLHDAVKATIDPFAVNSMRPVQIGCSVQRKCIQIFSLCQLSR
jgi:hypothetical protein